MGWQSCEEDKVENMNILFLTLIDFNTLDERNIYTDLLREFYKNGHKIYVVSPVERRKNVKTHLVCKVSTTCFQFW